MKRTIIGSVLMVIGAISTLSFVIIAAFYLPNIQQWRGSKLWFAIFGANDLVDAPSLSVGVPFTIGFILFIIGLLILIIEYFSKNKK